MIRREDLALYFDQWTLDDRTFPSTILEEILFCVPSREELIITSKLSQGLLQETVYIPYPEWLLVLLRELKDTIPFEEYKKYISFHVGRGPSVIDPIWRTSIIVTDGWILETCYIRDGKENFVRAKYEIPGTAIYFYAEFDNSKVCVSFFKQSSPTWFNRLPARDAEGMTSDQVRRMIESTGK
jgi:hypothetical protein